MKKALRFFAIFIFLISICSCSSSKETNSFDQFEESFLNKYPNGYIWEEQWYEFNSSTTFYNNHNSNKTTQTIKFKGKIQFGKDSFSGETNEFICESNTLDFLENGNVKQTYTFDSFKNNVWYSYEKCTDSTNNKETISTKGRNDLKSMSIGFDFIKEIFQPDLINYLASNSEYIFPFVPFNLSFENNECVKYSVIRSSSKDDLWFSDLKYSFDENLQFVEIKRIMHNSCASSSKENYNYINTASLKVIDETKFESNNNFDVVSTETRPAILKGFERGL